MSSLTFSGVSLPFASKILAWNLERFPNGVFYLFGSGRLALQSSLPKKAVEEYTKALECQSQYRNLHYISYWECSMATISLWDLESCLENWKPLKEQATWSRATYAYGMAVTLLEMGGEERLKEADALIRSVPTLAQKIAGKSIPIEKFVSRKTRRYDSIKSSTPSRSLLVPLLEFGYFFQCIAHAPLEILLREMIPTSEKNHSVVLGVEYDAQKGVKVKDVKKLAEGYMWDEYALLRFLNGVMWRYVAYADPDAAPESRELPASVPNPPSTEEAARRSRAALEEVLEIGPKIMLDHYLIYHAHYELGRLHANLGDEKEARKHLDLVLSGKPLEANSSARKGKYSMENTLIMRTTAAVDALDTGRKV